VTSTSTSNDVDEIYRRMAVIRRERHANVSESVAGAETVANWGRFTWTFPWIALGATVAVGYLVYRESRRIGSAQAPERLPEPEADPPLTAVSAPSQESTRMGQQILGAAWELALPVAVRAGQSFLLQWLEQEHPTKSVRKTADTPANGHG
jgi:hypothetical protein